MVWLLVVLQKEMAEAALGDNNVVTTEGQGKSHTGVVEVDPVEGNGYHSILYWCGTQEIKDGVHSRGRPLATHNNQPGKRHGYV